MFHSQHRKEAQAANVSMMLFRIAQAVKKMTQLESDAAGLSPVQIQALQFIHHTRSDMARMGNLADALGTTHVTAVKLVNGLMDKGLAAKTVHPEDRRITLLHLTPAGEQEIQRLQHWGHTLVESLQKVPEPQLTELAAGLGEVVRILHEDGYLVAAEPCLGCIHFGENVSEGHHFCHLAGAYLPYEAALKECPEHTPFPSRTQT